jgi:hypothetical protein
VLAADPSLEQSTSDDYVVTQRSAYGLPVDPETLLAVSVPSVDVGTAKWGFPLSLEEDRELALNDRIRFADEVGREALPFARRLPTYAGSYIDQLGNGGLVVMLTALDPEAVASIRELMPVDSRGVRFEFARHTRAELELALSRVPEVWGGTIGGLPLSTTGIDTVNNRLRVGVPASSLGRAPEASADLTRALGVPVHVHEEEPPIETVCTRNDCHTPLRAGIVIRNDHANSSGTCTMAFHVRMGTDEQFLTAGHCGCAYTAQDWHHQGYGLIGSETATLTGAAFDPNRKDIMRVQIDADTQASPFVYGHSGDMGQPTLPIDNETVYASLGISNVIKTGIVTEVWTNWGSDFCGVVMKGGDTNIGTIPGDSGSPLYRRFSSGGEWYITPIGVMATAAGQFGRVRDAQIHWGFTVVTP